MNNNNNDEFINEFCRRLQTLLANSPFAIPPADGSKPSPFGNPLAGIQQMGADAKENVRALGEAVLAQMNVVSRDEFEAQNAILTQAVEKLNDIEKKLSALEKDENS